MSNFVDSMDINPAQYVDPSLQDLLLTDVSEKDFSTVICDDINKIHGYDVKYLGDTPPSAIPSFTVKGSTESIGLIKFHS